jgi:hypothetical protein
VSHRADYRFASFLARLDASAQLFAIDGKPFPLLSSTLSILIFENSSQGE